MSGDLTPYLLIGALALVTYGTRVGGYLILSRFGALNPRVEAALDSIPVAVITAILAPIAFTNGLAELIGVGVAALVSVRYPMHITLIAAVPTVAILRALGL